MSYTNMCFQVNGTRVPIGSSYPNFTISHNGRSVQLTADFGLVVKFDGSHSFSIDIPVSFFNQTEGISGNFDGIAGNDLVEADDPNESYCLTGQQWEVEDPEYPG